MRAWLLRVLGLPWHTGGGYVPTEAGNGKRPPQMSGTAGPVFVGDLPTGVNWRAINVPTPRGYAMTRIMGRDLFNRCLDAAGKVP